MRGGAGAAGIDFQRQLSEYLYAEMLHTLGVYRYACEGLEHLRDELGGPEAEGHDGQRWLGSAVESSLYCNEQLRDHLHRAASPGAAGRRPSPFWPGEEPSRPDHKLLGRIASFYRDMESALGLHLEDRGAAERRNPSPAHRLGKNYAFVQDPHRRAREPEARFEEIVEGRIARTRKRCARVEALTPGDRGPEECDGRDERLAELLGSCAGGPHGAHLRTIVEAMNEAHMWMHQAEHVRAQNFGEMFTEIPKRHAETQDMLRYSLVLNTFVFVGARAAPWIFAEDAGERDYVIDNYSKCWESLAPTYCMWIAAQFSLLALHRRAFTYWTFGEHDSAYRDFHKLNRLLRGLRRPIEQRGLRVPGTKTFVEGVGGMSEHHIGRIYRGQHAHRMALRYFKRAARRLRGWEKDPDIGHLVKASHWRINLLTNEGKANYELGRAKRSIFHYAQAWRAYLLLVESETHATANLDVVEDLIGWLEPIVDEPELNRWELRGRLKPLVDQFTTLRSPPHLRLLAADIVMRMGHLLFVLKLPPAEWKPGDGPAKSDHDLAQKCVAKAAFLDPSSTLAAADVLKVEYDINEPLPQAEKTEALPLAQQWPSGSGRFEEAARITEYVLQGWLAETAPMKGRQQPHGRRKVARDLLGAFLAHTDSSNVKLAQVYRYLMQEPTLVKRDLDDGRYGLDFLCLRRYSSFFPFLPRPSAFRAPGGGYFVCVNEPRKRPFGIAIDPGPDFIENLYRCGFSLADIHMIVLTHDHADHIVSLDSMLALMWIRNKDLGEPTFGKDARLVIVGNESVCRRYAFYNDKRHPTFEKDGVRQPRKDTVRVMTFEQIEGITAKDEPARADAIDAEEILLTPETLRIERVRTWGHADANGYVSQGFLISAGRGKERSSVLFTGDTGAPSTLRGGRGEAKDAHMLADGSKSLHAAVLEADVVVAHLSSVPLRELRNLAGLKGAGKNEAMAEYARLWEEAGRRSREEDHPPESDQAEGVRQTQFLLEQIQFGFRSKPADEADGFTVTPFSKTDLIKKEPSQHLYLSGLLDIAELMASRRGKRAPLLLIGELREELGTFRTRIADLVAGEIFGGRGASTPAALTADIGLRVRVSGPATGTSGGGENAIRVLCTTCDLDNDLIPAERFHRPGEIHEVCVKCEDEGVFFNCSLHNPRDQADYMWLELVERYDPFGD